MFLLGGLVRVTGSGMGCPDWPKCFGLLTPPTCACQLPANYQQIFLNKRIQKVQKFTRVLEMAGFKEKADKIRKDASIFRPEEFNAVKAWIEYINRIFGVIAGFLTLAFALYSIKRRKTPGVFRFGALALLMLLINAWLGSIVVATNLLPGIVTVHFLLSFLCIFFIIQAMHKQAPFKIQSFGRAERNSMRIFFALLIFEVVLGTFAREQVEFLSGTGKLTTESGMLNIGAMGLLFAIHRFLPGAIFLWAGLIYLKRRRKANVYPFLYLAVISLLQICFGAFNVVMALPPWSQIIHIFIGSVLPVLAFYYMLVHEKTEEFKELTPTEV